MPRVVPDDWMPNAAMRRIHLHWTAGGHSANATDKGAYHILVEDDGRLVRGDNSIERNAPPSRSPRASHTKNANTGAIGVSLCCMRQARENPFDPGPSPMTQTQWEVGMQVLADLADAYRIAITPTTVLTHAEVEPNLGIAQDNKWDITRLPFDRDVRGHAEVGRLMRRRVAALMDGDGDAPGIDDLDGDADRAPRFRVSGVAPSTLNLRRAPMGTKIARLSERVMVERLGIDDEWWKVRVVRTGHVGWVHSGFLARV